MKANSPLVSNNFTHLSQEEKGMTNKNTFVPEEQFTVTPEEFSAVSHILEVKTEDRGDGIILDSIKEVERALRIYNGEGGSIEESMATNMDLMENIQKQSGSFGVGLLALAGAERNRGKDFVGTMVQAIKCSLAEDGRYHVSYDYDAMGSNFFKTSVEVLLIDGKFLLRINAAYVGKEPEIALAEKLGKPRGLQNAVINIPMSVVDGWWFNINLKDVLKIIIGEISEEDAMEWAKKVIDGGSIPLGWPKGEHLIIGHISLDFSQYFNQHTPKDRDRDKTFHMARGCNVVGAAWDGYRDDRYSAVPAGPTLEISFNYPGENGYRSAVAVIPEKIELLQTMRNELAGKIIPEQPS
jgi:hypothetical protein